MQGAVVGSEVMSFSGEEELLKARRPGGLTLFRTLNVYAGDRCPL